MGLHTGEPRLTEGGTSASTYTRGRVSPPSATAAGAAVADDRALVDADVRDLGLYRLKDLSAPERIYQLEIQGLLCDFRY